MWGRRELAIAAFCGVAVANRRHSLARESSGSARGADGECRIGRKSLSGEDRGGVMMGDEWVSWRRMAVDAEACREGCYLQRDRRRSEEEKQERADCRRNSPGRSLSQRGERDGERGREMERDMLSPSWESRKRCCVQMWGAREGGGEQASDMRMGRKIGPERSETCLGVKLRWMERDVGRMDSRCRSSC